jgi:ferredoxin
LNVAGFVPPVARVLRLLGVDPAELQPGARQASGSAAGSAAGVGNYAGAAPARRWPVMTLPPGAVPNFYNLCTRCNDCVKACPHWAIRPA